MTATKVKELDVTWEIADLPTDTDDDEIKRAEPVPHPKLTLARADEIINRMFRHDRWESHRVIGTEYDGTARATRRDEDRLFVIKNSRIEDWI